MTIAPIAEVLVQSKYHAFQEVFPDIPLSTFKPPAFTQYAEKYFLVSAADCMCRRSICNYKTSAFEQIVSMSNAPMENGFCGNLGGRFSSWKDRLFCGWLAFCLAFFLNLITGFISVPREWYSYSLYLRQQTDAFFKGHVALDSSPYSLNWDLVWDHGIQQVSGLGVPAFRFAFEALARMFGYRSFPDRVTFLIACMLCFWFLMRTFAGSGDGNGAGSTAEGWKRIRIFWGLSLLIFAPPFVTLVSTRFEVYEEVVAYGYLYSLVLFAGFLRTVRHPTTSKLLALSLWAGLGVWVRPPLLFYGVVTVGLASIIAWRAQIRRGVVYSFLLFGICGALLGFSNQSRFGGFAEFGHSLNVTALNHNTYALKFDYPFRTEPLFSAARDEMATLFFVHGLNGHDYYRKGIMSGQSSSYRWHEMYFSTFDAGYLFLFLMSALLWFWNFKRIRMIWNANFTTRQRSTREGGATRLEAAHTLLAVPWALFSFGCLFLFYLWSPSLASRYNVDFLPSVMVCISALVWNGFEWNLLRGRREVFFGLGTTLFWLALCIFTAKIDPGYTKRSSLDKNRLDSKMHEPFVIGEPDDLHSYQMGDTNGAVGIPFNCDGWNLDNGQVKPVVTVFVSNPNCIVMSVFGPQGKSLDADDLAPIRAKIGLEYLTLESTEIHSNTATIVFAGPRNPRYQTGLQVCFLAFIHPEDLGRQAPMLHLASIAFTKTIPIQAAITRNNFGVGVNSRFSQTPGDAYEITEHK